MAPTTLYYLPFDMLRKFGSKVLHLIFSRGFAPGRPKILGKRKERYHSAEG
jgi:hypothetical protein